MVRNDHVPRVEADDTSPVNRIDTAALSTATTAGLDITAYGKWVGLDDVGEKQGKQQLGLVLHKTLLGCHNQTNVIGGGQL